MDTSIINTVLLCFMLAMNAFLFVALGRRNRAFYIPKFLLPETVNAIDTKIKALNALLTSVIAIDEDGVIVSLNETVQKMFLYSEAELRGKNITILMEDHDAANHIRGMKASKLSNHVNFKERSLRVFGLRKDKTKIPIKLRLIKSDDSEGRVIFIGVMQDMTDELKEQEALKVITDTLYKKISLLECAEELLETGAWNWCTNSGFIELSRNCKKILEAEEDLVHVDFLLKKVWATDREKVSKEIDKAYNGESYSVEYRLALSGGLVARLLTHGKPEVKDGITVRIHGATELLKITTFEDAILHSND